MSAFEGKADVLRRAPEGRLLTQSRHFAGIS